MTRILMIVAVAMLAGCSDRPEPTAVDVERVPGAVAELRGTTLDALRSAGWDCQQRGPTFISCAPPGIGLPPIPSLGVDGRPVYELAVFGLDGTPVATAHFVRADPYQGRPAPSRGSGSCSGRSSATTSV